MASTRASKRYKEWGRKLRGSQKARRNGSVGKKKRRKVWGETPTGRRVSSELVTRGRSLRVTREIRHDPVHADAV